MEQFLVEEVAGLAHACRTLGIEAPSFTSVEDLEQMVLARGREKPGCAGLAELAAACVHRLPDEAVESLREALRKKDHYRRN